MEITPIPKEERIKAEKEKKIAKTAEADTKETKGSDPWAKWKE
jgi:hypothetical protein